MELQGRRVANMLSSIRNHWVIFQSGEPHYIPTASVCKFHLLLHSGIVLSTYLIFAIPVGNYCKFFISLMNDAEHLYTYQPFGYLLWNACSSLLPLFLLGSLSCWYFFLIISYKFMCIMNIFCLGLCHDVTMMKEVLLLRVHMYLIFFYRSNV